MSHSIEFAWHGDGIALVTFSDPARANQLCWAAVDALGDTLVQCREQGARVVVLASGLPGHWLEHAWLRDLSNGIQGQALTGTGAGWFTAQQELAHREVISIAAICGDCSGGGAEIGWACDFRIAEEQARFCQPEINMGLTTGIGGTSRLSRLVGRATATEMVLTGRPQSSARLHALGAITRVVPEGQGIAAALTLAGEIAEKSPQALAGFKRILSANDEPLQEELRREQEIFQSVVVGDEARSGMEAVQSAYEEGATTAELNGYDRDD